MAHPTFAARGGYGLLCAASAAAVVLGDFLFFHHSIGCSLAIFAGFLLICLSVRGIDSIGRWEGRVLLLVMIGLLAALVIEPTPLNFMATILALGSLAMLRARSTLAAWAEAWMRLLVTGWLRIVQDNRIVAAWVRRNPTSRAAKWNLSNWFIPIILSAVFVALFAWANPIISNVMTSIEKWIEVIVQKIPNLIDGLRIALWIGLAAGTWGLLRARLRRNAKPQAAVIVIRETVDFSEAMIARCLLLFNVVFLIETLLDITYLWGGHALPQGMTYKEYARRGAYPLVATALLAAVFVLVTFRSGSATERSVRCRRLVYLWCAQNVFLLISAAWRLKLYVDADNLTRLRFAAALWMILVAGGFVWIAWRIISQRGNGWLLRVNMLTAAAMLYVCCFVNVDGYIARYNVDHCRELGGEDWLDMQYMEVLGPDALPALAKVRQHLRPQKREQADLLVAQFASEIEQNISDWRGWTVRRQTLATEAQRTSFAIRYAVENSPVASIDPAVLVVDPPVKTRR